MIDLALKETRKKGEKGRGFQSLSLIKTNKLSYTEFSHLWMVFIFLFYVSACINFQWLCAIYARIWIQLFILFIILISQLLNYIRNRINDCLMFRHHPKHKSCNGMHASLLQRLHREILSPWVYTQTTTIFCYIIRMIVFN